MFIKIRRPLQGSSGVWDPFCSLSPSFFFPLGMPKVRLGLPPPGTDYPNLANGLFWPWFFPFFLATHFLLPHWRHTCEYVAQWHQKVIQKYTKTSLFVAMGNLVPIRYLLIRSYMGSSRGAPKSHPKNNPSQPHVKSVQIGNLPWNCISLGHGFWSSIGLKSHLVLNRGALGMPSGLKMDLNVLNMFNSGSKVIQSASKMNRPCSQ